MREETLILTLFAFIGLVDPHAAMGAAFGCMFYLSVPKEENESRFLLPIVSLGIGYSAGVAIGEPHTMWSSLVFAALGSTVLTVLHAMIVSGGSLPEWLQYLINTILRVKK